MHFLRLTFVLFGISSSAFATVLVEQTPIPLGNPNVGNTGLSSSDADFIIEQSLAYDNFTIATDVDVSAVQWIGAFNNVFNPDLSLHGANDFKITFYGDAAGNKPDVRNVIATYVLDGGTAARNDGADVIESVVPNQSHRTGGSIASYAADIPDFRLAPGNYWLSIQARQQLPSDPDLHEDPQWSWVLSTDADQRSYQYDELHDPIGSQPGIAIAGFDLAYALIGNAPEIAEAGDFDFDGDLDANDIDFLAAAIRDASPNLQFDVDLDGNLTDADFQYWISTIKGTVLGDANLDGTVDFSDFLDFRRNFLGVGGWAQGNFTTDRKVDFNDFLAFARNFGVQAPTSESVPEPRGVFCLGIGAVAIVFGRRGSCQDCA